MPSQPFDERIACWLSRLLTDAPPGSDIVAYNVGLFETEEGYCAYLSGSTKFDSTSDSWALEEAYRPSHREFPFPDDILAFPKWQDALSQFQSALSLALKRPELAHSVLARAQAVTVGFDDGDLERVL